MTRTSRVRGPWTPSTRLFSMSLVAEGPEIQVKGREWSTTVSNDAAGQTGQGRCVLLVERHPIADTENTSVVFTLGARVLPIARKARLESAVPAPK